jgi:hypothetical protein
MDLKVSHLKSHLPKIRKAPKGNSESLWSLHIRSFWKNHFINPPEALGVGEVGL